MDSFYPFRPGDWVEVRPVADVLATLDHHASLEELLFMPEMVQYCGHRFQVGRSLDADDSLNGATCSRRMAGTFNLETYCDGSGHGGCEGRCLLFWKAAWLKAADGPATDEVTPCSAATADVEWLEAA